MHIRIYTRRSKNDEGKQQFSLDVQGGGCRAFLAGSPFAGAKVVEYVDDGKSGDDFHGRMGLRQLLQEARRGDVIVCRDQSRLGRDAIEVTLVVRDLVRDRGCRLFYYVNGQEALFANAIDQATTFIQGTGHQMELEAIRSRVREALRSRVRASRIAGGRCFGYRLHRRADGEGRPFTVATVDEASVVRRIFAMRCEGLGFKKIAHQLNADAVPPPAAGKRGTGTWAPGCIRAMLLNARYRGVYVHGKVKKLRQGGAVTRVRADASDVITVEVPEWRIIDDETWARAQQGFAPEGARPPSPKARNKYALSGIGRCANCDGSIVCAMARKGGGFVKTYACVRNLQRGPRACAVSIRQEMADVDGAIVGYLQAQVTEAMVDAHAIDVRTAIEGQIPRAEDDTAGLEAELRAVKAEQRRLTRAVALADDVPELVTELRERACRARDLERRLAAAKSTPEELRQVIAQVEAKVRTGLADLRHGLRQSQDLRQVCVRAFPGGLRFHAARVDGRQVWKIAGETTIGQLAGVGELPISNADSDPRGT